MRWDEEKERIEELIQATLNCWNEEAMFAKKLLKILDRARGKNLFLDKARQEAEGWPNPWLRDDLVGFLDMIESGDDV